MLVAGSALATVWLFVTLEQFFGESTNIPMWALILLAPIYPFVAWALQAMPAVYPFYDPPGELQVDERMDDLRILYEFDCLDSNELRDPEVADARFAPEPYEVEEHLGVPFPEGFAKWITAAQGRTLKWVDESLIRAWPWGAIKEHPVAAENSLIFFADCDLDGHRGHLAVDLRDSPSKGSVVQYGLYGRAPHWELVGDPRMLATNFSNWTRYVTRSFAHFPSA